MIMRDKRMGKIFPRPPMAVFKRGKTVKEILVKARLPANRGGGGGGGGERRSERNERVGFTRCSKGGGRRECRMCPYTWEGRRVGAMVRGNETVKEVDMGTLGPPIKIEHKLNCRSDNVIYVAKDLRDEKVYAGETKREVRARLSEHVRAIENASDDTAVGEHFTRMGHSANDLVLVPVIKVTGGDQIRKSLERTIINRYRLVEKGMNKRF